MIDLERPFEQPRVGRHAVALGEEEHVAGHEHGRLDLLGAAVANDGGPNRKIACERLDRTLGLPLLREGKERVQDDHRQDREPEHGCPGHEGEAGGDPQEQCQRMGDLLCELARPAPAAHPHELVAAVDDEPPFDLAARETVRTGRRLVPKRHRRSAHDLAEDASRMPASVPPAARASIRSRSDQGCGELPKADPGR